LAAVSKGERASLTAKTQPPQHNEAVHLIFQINVDGETNRLEGVQLLSIYLILGILFFYLPERAHGG